MVPALQISLALCWVFPLSMPRDVLPSSAQRESTLSFQSSWIPGTNLLWKEATAADSRKQHSGTSDPRALVLQLKAKAVLLQGVTTHTWEELGLGPQAYTG